MAIIHKKENIMFVIKKIVALISISIMSNRKQKNSGDKIKNFVEINLNTTHFSMIMKGIQMMTMMISMKKQII